MLNQNPDLSRVRLELARACFLDRDYEESRFQFELLKGGGTAPAGAGEGGSVPGHDPGHVIGDHRLETTTRRDKTWQIYTSLSSNIFEKYGISPVLQ
jgi:hypothetical protein